MIGIQIAHVLIQVLIASVIAELLRSLRDSKEVCMYRFIVCVCLISCVLVTSLSNRGFSSNISNKQGNGND